MVLFLALFGVTTVDQGYLFAQSTNPSPPLEFSYGQSCSKLGALTGGELIHLIQNHNSSYFKSFCRPETYFDCYDYQPFLQGHGTLKSATDGFYCQFLPALAH